MSCFSWYEWILYCKNGFCKENKTCRVSLRILQIWFVLTFCNLAYRFNKNVSLLMEKNKT